MGRSRIGRDQWIILVSAQAASGMTAAAFFKRRKLPLASFYQWRSKLAAATNLGKDQQPNLVPLRVVDEVSVDVELPSGATIKLPAANGEAIRHVLSVLVDLGLSWFDGNWNF